MESHGDRWVQQRRFALHILRDFGLGKNLMEEKVLSEVTAMIESVQKNKEDIDLQNLFDASVGSVINNLLFGYRYDEVYFQENSVQENSQIISDKYGRVSGTEESNEQAFQTNC